MPRRGRRRGVVVSSAEYSGSAGAPVPGELRKPVPSPMTEPVMSKWIFPDPIEAEDDIVAVGADLEPETILSAYRQGIFPMPLSDYDEMSWWSPVMRGVLPIEGLRVTRSMRKSARKFTVTVDCAYDEVVEACADPARPGGWIDSRIQKAYRGLFDLGHVHSIEVWRDGRLAGGLYGVSIAGLFAGESMFHRVRDASKVALMALVDMLRDGQPDRLIDVQWSTAHLESLGVVELPRAEYLHRLGRALSVRPPTLRPR
jgi:leucyl/phenylalanyl-tRNA--protein transferase